MRKKRIMLIGVAGSGKTSLANILNDLDGPAGKTQDIIYKKNTMDVPGSYLENPWMYKHLIAAAQDASHILMLVDQSKNVDSYPPGFARIFTCPVIGVISKCDQNPENEGFCIRQLKQSGAPLPYYKISCRDKTGISALKEWLKEI